jgi:hypothetical protein
MNNLPVVVLLAVSTVSSVSWAALPDTLSKSGFETCPAPAQYCADVDHDGYGDIGFCITTCERPYDFLALAPTDCNNDSAAIHPDAPETCDGLDNNCDGSSDENDPGGGNACFITNPGVGTCPGVTQCTEGQIVCNGQYPTPEICLNGLDDDCDGTVDEVDCMNF